MKRIANESSKAFMANVADNGLAAFTQYGSLLLLLVDTMLLVVLVFGLLVIFIYLRRNPYPLVYRCFKESGVTAFFTRSSAANIPVSMQLCEKLGLDKDIFRVHLAGRHHQYEWRRRDHYRHGYGGREHVRYRRLMCL